jgi:hypothetical protein
MVPVYLRHTVFAHVVGRSSWIFAALLLAGCGSGDNSSAPPSVAATGTPGAEADAGERLFLETRFAQSFSVFLANGGDINDPNAGDQVVAKVILPGHPNGGVISQFVGMSMNCRSCHFVD